MEDPQYGVRDTQPNRVPEQNRSGGGRWVLIFIGLMLFIGLLVAASLYVLSLIVQNTAERALQPVQQANESIRTQVAQLINPTPTILPDPITIVREIRTLARLETIQYSVEKVISAETNQNAFGFLFGDKLLFVAHGVVIAGVDLSKLGPEDIRIDGDTMTVRLPAAEVFVATLDNEKSYVYNRETGILSSGEKDLETNARQAAEREVLKAAVEDGILDTAQQNAESFLSRMLGDMGYAQVVFEQATPEPSTTSIP